MKKKKICFVGELNSVHLQKWVNYFKNSNFFDVFVISASKVSSPDVPYTYYDEFIPGWFRKFPVVPKLTFLLKIFLLKRFLRKLNPDIIHIHQLGSFGVLFGLTNYHPMIVSTWGSDIIDDASHTKLGKKKREVLLRADLITATSNFLARETEKFVGETKKIEVVPFGVDVKIFDGYKVKHQGINIGFYKHLKEKYGPKYLIKAINLIKNKHKNIHVFIAGKGEQREELKNLAKNIAVDHLIEFIGWLPPEKLIKYYRITDIVAMPSVLESETFGVAAVEASAMGLPVIASNVGGVSEVVKNGETGILIEPKKIDSLAEAISKLVENKSMRVKMGKAGRKFVKETYNWNNNTQIMENLYRCL